MENSNRYAVIYANILYDNEISDFAKILYAALSNLARRNGYCYASNSFLAGQFNKSESSITKTISQLQKRGHISVEIEKNNDRKIFVGEQNSKEPSIETESNEIAPADGEIFLPEGSKKLQGGVVKNSEEGSKKLQGGVVKNSDPLLITNLNYENNLLNRQTDSLSDGVGVNFETATTLAWLKTKVVEYYKSAKDGWMFDMSKEFSEFCEEIARRKKMRIGGAEISAAEILKTYTRLFTDDTNFKKVWEASLYEIPNNIAKNKFAYRVAYIYNQIKGI